MAPYLGLKGRALRFWLTLACSVAMMPLGYDQALSPNLPAFLSPSEHVTASFNLASCFGALCVLHVGELLGRKRTMLFSAAIMACGALLQVSSVEFVQMIVGRIVSGLGNGIATATAPLWLAEMAGAKARGRIIVTMMAGSALGFAAGNWVEFGMSNVQGEVAFRVPMAVKLMFIIFLLATVPWLPESPRWLMSQGRIIQATSILADLKGKDKEDTSITTEALRMNSDICYARRNKPPWKAILRGRGGPISRRIVLGMGVQAMQQLLGIAVTAYFLPLILTKCLGVSTHLARLLTACNATAFFLSSLGAIYIVPRFGRRKPMIFSSLSQSLSLLLFTLTTRFLSPNHTPIPSLIFLLTYHISFALSSWNATPWLLPIELTNQATRTQAVALSTATNWLVSFAVVEVTPLAIDNWGWKFFIVWTVLNFLFAGVVYACYFEMEGVDLEDVEWLEWEGYPVFGRGRKPVVRERARDIERGKGQGCVQCEEEGGKQVEPGQMFSIEGTSVRDMATGGLPVVLERCTMGRARGGLGQGQRRVSVEVGPRDGPEVIVGDGGAVGSTCK
ncbi:hypothetical protein B0T14DRAFT_466130 [Immersiella caudata]|uniref:Major facilitator superfamily (MFS) profile domain-containing protein n=1 Tax=Immersiella caudata TaxID=314043 RepID=A0AA40CAM7_9PEZI|nr:hypothetical protein B0T14DRAFT_466130 [Immersiella caudata]